MRYRAVLDRRDFLKTFGAAVVGATVGKAAQVEPEPETLFGRPVVWTDDVMPTHHQAIIVVGITAYCDEKGIEVIE
jgi:hypothetical protein